MNRLFAGLTGLSILAGIVGCGGPSGPAPLSPEEQTKKMSTHEAMAKEMGEKAKQGAANRPRGHHAQ